MPKRGAVAISLTALALVLLLNFRTPGDAATIASGRPGSAGAVGTPGAVGAGSAQAGAQAGSQTVSGPVVSTRYGPVQVQITVVDGKLSDVAAVQLPTGDRRSASISSRAEPTLRSEALTAQSAAIDGVSGATYTSTAYARSLQAALDTAGI
jgi:uncharacterized protein with FMN-binding domain